jgi:transcriptional regulator with XRE-family HTH domain
MQAIDYKKIKDLREKDELSQSEVAAFIGVSRPTYALVELGKNDLTVMQLLRLAEYLKVEPEDLIPQLSTTGESYAKFKQLILNCIKYGSDSGDHKITKTKLAKLVYLADFNWFYGHSTSISGLTYRNIQRGPVADQYFRAIDEMFEEDRSIAIESRGTALLISSTEQVSRDKLTDQQVELIQQIGEKWRDKSTADIVNFTHGQRPWQQSKPGELIAYDSILQEASSNLF